MSGNVCSYVNCGKSRKKNPGISMFRFPLSEELSQRWVENCGNVSLLGMSVKDRNKKSVCADHFQKDMIFPKGRLLYRNAVPTKFIPVSEPEVSGLKRPSAPRQYSRKINSESGIDRRIMEKKQKLTVKCCYNPCNNSNNYNENKAIYFIPFPKTCTRIGLSSSPESIEQHLTDCGQCDQVAKWIKACNSNHIKSIKDMTEDLFVCSLHFFGGNGPTEQFPDPIPLIVGDIKIKSEYAAGDEEMLAANEQEDLFIKTEIKEELDIEEHNLVGEASTQTYSHHNPTNKCLDQSTNTEASTVNQMDEFERSLEQDSATCCYLTGFKLEQIRDLLKYLGTPPVTDTKLTHLQQLILVLIRLRRGFTVQYLFTLRYSMDKDFATELVKVWIPFMYTAFEEKLGAEMPKKIDVNKLKHFESLKMINPLNNGGSMAQIALVCTCLQKFQPTLQVHSESEDEEADECKFHEVL